MCKVTIAGVETTLDLKLLEAQACSLAFEAFRATSEQIFSFALSGILQDAIVNPVRSAADHDPRTQKALKSLKSGHQPVIYRADDEECPADCPADWGVFLQPAKSEPLFFNITDVKFKTDFNQAVAQSQANILGDAGSWGPVHHLILSMPMTAEHCGLLLTMSSADGESAALWSMALAPTVGFDDIAAVAAIMGVQQAALNTFLRRPDAFAFEKLPTIPCPFPHADIEERRVTSINNRVFKVFLKQTKSLPGVSCGACVNTSWQNFHL
jgi:hypothetical protein